MLLRLLDLLLQGRDALAQQPAVHLQLPLPGPAKPHTAVAAAAAAALPLEVGPELGEPRQAVHVQGQLHLQLPLARARVLREDVEDERRAVDDLDARALAPELDLEVALLPGAQLVVQHHRAAFELAHGPLHLGHLAGPDEGARVALLHALVGAAHDLEPRRARQFAELQERLLQREVLVGAPGLELEAHEEALLALLREAWVVEPQRPLVQDVVDRPVPADAAPRGPRHLRRRLPPPLHRPLVLLRHHHHLRLLLPRLAAATIAGDDGAVDSPVATIVVLVHERRRRRRHPRSPLLFGLVRQRLLPQHLLVVHAAVLRRGVWQRALAGGAVGRLGAHLNAPERRMVQQPPRGHRERARLAQEHQQ